jgi:hypothetical protein
MTGRAELAVDAAAAGCLHFVPILLASAREVRVKLARGGLMPALLPQVPSETPTPPTPTPNRFPRLATRIAAVHCAVAA